MSEPLERGTYKEVRVNDSSLMCSNCKAVEVKRPGYCKPCAAAYGRDWRKRNPEKTRRDKKRYRSKPNGENRAASNQKYYLANRELVMARSNLKKMKRRALTRGVEGGNVTPADRASIFERQKGKCWWCPALLDSAFHLDHVIPLSKGGPHVLGNLVASCPQCNKAKAAKMPWEFAGRLF